jgi:spermidine/putrescine ABC transporter ATP-binding subunit
MSQPDVQLEQVTKRFGETVAVSNFTLDVQSGEFLCLLGPSGCGKTTLLRMLAGLEEPTEGTIKLTGEVVNGIPAYKRDTAMVFQNWALFPHKNVFDNISFGLKMRGVPKAIRQERVKEYLDMVRLPGLERRMPGQLSGGQQQRVALARALIIEPKVLLMDEPLSNLDLKLRQQMRVEIRQIQKRIGITTIFVTHDQTEALELSDRVVVVNQGHIEQVGLPAEVYEQPATRFVADFIGESNFFEGTVVSVNSTTAVFKTRSGLSINMMSRTDLTEGSECSLAVRPELIGISPLSSDGGVSFDNSVPGKILMKTYLGAFIRYDIDLDDENRIFIDRRISPDEPTYSVGDEINVGWSADGCVCFPK